HRESVARLADPARVLSHERLHVRGPRPARHHDLDASPREDLDRKALGARALAHGERRQVQGGGTVRKQRELRAGGTHPCIFRPPWPTQTGVARGRDLGCSPLKRTASPRLITPRTPATSAISLRYSSTSRSSTISPSILTAGPTTISGRSRRSAL